MQTLPLIRNNKELFEAYLANKYVLTFMRTIYRREATKRYVLVQNTYLNCKGILSTTGLIPEHLDVEETLHSLPATEFKEEGGATYCFFAIDKTPEALQNFLNAFTDSFPKPLALTILKEDLL